jgi:hypothetical protein
MTGVSAPPPSQVQRVSQPDGHLLCTAIAALQSTGYGHLRQLACEVNDGVARISGVVPSFYLKQVAQTALLTVADLKGVTNLVEVQRTTVSGKGV